MELLQAGVDFSVIALWLGRESIETTQTMRISHSRKQPWRSSNRTSTGSQPASSQSDRLLAFLEAL